MKVKDQAAWAAFVAQNSDVYAALCVSYAERWADLMEVRLAEGPEDPLITIPAVAEDMSYDANTEQISLAQYGMAGNVLTRFWIYGEILRSWLEKQ